MAKLADLNEKVAEMVTDGYKKIENTFVDGYKQIERSAVEGFNNISDKCIETLFSKEGETIDETKERLSYK